MPEQQAYPSIDNLDTATAMAYGLFMKPGQIPGQMLDTPNGIVPSAIYNKPRSHPDREKVEGILVYNPRKSTDPINELKAEKDKLASEVLTMQAQIQALMGLQTAPAAPVPTLAETEVASMKADLETMGAELKQFRDKESAAKEKMANARASRGKKKTAGNTSST